MFEDTEVGVESPGRQDFSLRSRIAPLLQKLGPSSESRVRACPRLSTPTSVLPILILLSEGAPVAEGL